jgi:transcriptional regulator GlxA family with amidase domain
MSTFQLAIRGTSTQELRAAIFTDAMAIIEAEFAQRLTLAEVARRIATSPRQLQRAYSEAGRTSFARSLRQVRMAHAAELLATTDLPVKEVARQVGYRHIGQFRKIFRRTHGASPSAYRAASAGSSTKISALRSGS